VEVDLAVMLSRPNNLQHQSGAGERTAVFVETMLDDGCIGRAESAMSSRNRRTVVLGQSLSTN
jgi:hypothetical protein